MLPDERLRTTSRQIDETVGGHSFVGVDAWAHLEDAAGPTMREFLERYIRKPLDDLLSNGVDVEGEY